MKQAALRRTGDPVAALVILLGGWVLVRAALWQSPFPEVLPDLGSPGFVAAAPAILADGDNAADGGSLAPETARKPADSVIPLAPIVAGPWLQQAGAHGSAAMRGYPDRVSANLGEGSGQPDLSGHHRTLHAAELDYTPPPTQSKPMMAEHAARAKAPVIVAAAGWPGTPQQQRPGRWSFDGWALWRSGSGQTFAAATPSPSYGASQAGAVLRYRIAPSTDLRPEAYVRVTRALVANGESEIAAGLSARPISPLPLRGHAEVRATNRPGTTEIRPAAFATTEFPTQDLPMGLRASLYAQGGYVGGDFATAFADGQLKVDREVARFNLGSVLVGAGAWGGAQRGAARLDVGPSATMALDSGPIPARLSVDYRVRVAGDAQPGSGVAVTLTTGF